ncbi:MAG: arylsulfatase [Planctomycetales bacterium]|nr:arylsulfatase [Planctomycetales bacterium]
MSSWNSKCWLDAFGRQCRSIKIVAAICVLIGANIASLQAAKKDPAADAAKPNIVFILADDMGYGDVAHAGGLAATPHIDRLRAEGMRFTNGHTTSSVCTPTRYGILTGRYNWRSPLKRSVLFGLDTPLIPSSRATVASFLHDRGYRTGVVGKWHLGLGWQKLPNGEKRESASGPTKGGGWDIDYNQKVEGGPTALGFDSSFIIPASLDMFPYVYLQDDRPVEPATVTKAFHRAGPAAKSFEAVNCLRDFAAESRRFIARDSEKKQPFFLYLPLTSPHTPIVPSPAWQGKSKLGPYGDFVMETDWVVGQVLEELDKQGLADNTLVIFTTDNGCSPAAKIPDLVKKGHYPNAHWRGHKADIFEGGHRVPFLARWPGHVKPGSEYGQLVCSVDLFATAAEILGEAEAVGPAAAEDSFSFLSALEGDRAKTRESLIHHSIAGQFAISRGKWKLCLCPGSGGWSEPRPAQAVKDKSLPPVQLFDLDSDPSETTNLVDQHPDVVAGLVEELATAIAHGRTTAGPKQANDGWPKTFAGRVLAAYPQLEEK